MGGENQDQIRQPSGVLKWIRFRTPKNKGHAQKKTASGPQKTRATHKKKPQPGEDGKCSPGSPGTRTSAPRAARGGREVLPRQLGGEDKRSPGNKRSGRMYQLSYGEAASLYDS